MSHTPVAADVGKPLNSHRYVAPEITFNPEIPLYHCSYLQEVVIRKVFDP